MLKLYNSVPDELKQEFNRRRKEFVKNNTLKLWKKFLIDLYDKQSRSTPKHFPDYIKGMFRNMRNIDKGIKRYNYGKKKIKRKSKMKKEKISQSLKKKCKKLKVRLTVKRGDKRVYKSEKVLKKQCEKAMKKNKKVVKRKRKFGAARKSGRVVPRMSSGFGRPYVGYTVGGTVRFGSRRPEFHYPEYVLKGYNTAKTSKKYRFGSRRPEFHYPEHILKGYNTAKDCKKYRFGKSKKIKDERFRDFKKNPLIKEEIYFIEQYTVGLKNKKEMQKFVSLCAKLGKRDLKTKKILVTEKDKKFLVDHGYPPMLLKIEHYCGLNPNTCRGIGIGGALALGAGVGIYQSRKKLRFGKPINHRELTKKELMALSGLGGLGLGVGGTLGYQYLRRPKRRTPLTNRVNINFDDELDEELNEEDVDDLFMDDDDEQDGPQVIFKYPPPKEYDNLDHVEGDDEKPLLFGKKKRKKRKGKKKK